MPTPDLDHEQHEIAVQSEVVARGRPVLGLALSAVAVLGLGFVMATGGSDPSDRPPPSTTEPTAVDDDEAATDLPSTADAEPRIEGTLRTGDPFEVYEQSQGVLCAVFPDSVPPDDAATTQTPEICHLELVTASGAALIDDVLVFGYLAPGASSTALRYRVGPIDNNGIRIEQNARFFAIPIGADDPYRLQYRSDEFDLVDEVPLVALAGGPSQSASDAERDGVPSPIADLPFNRRVQVIEDWTHLPEGPYAWSRTLELDGITGWAEILLLDETGTEIVRSTPLPTVRLTARLVVGDSIYVIGQQVTAFDEIAVDLGELQFPIVVAVVDRASGAATVRLFGQESTSAEPEIAPELAWPGWLLGPNLPLIQLDILGLAGDTIQLLPADGGPAISLDRVSLLPVPPAEA